MNYGRRSVVQIVYGHRPGTENIELVLLILKTVMVIEFHLRERFLKKLFQDECILRHFLP